MVTGGRYATARPGGFSRRTAALVATVLVVFAASLLTFSHGSLNLDITRLDLDVYRLGARAWLTGQGVYGKLPSVQSGLDLGFTYPPISAVAMVPLAVVPARIAGIIMTGLTIGLLLAVIALFLRTAGLVPDYRSGWRRAAAFSPLAVLIEPVRTTLAFGQINVLLMALVAFDCLLPRTRWPRGVLVGVAAALKLTPAVFVLYFLATRQYRSAGRAVLSLAAVTGIGFLLAPGDSVSYWTGTVFQTGRVGSQSFFDNQSLTGLLSRAGLTGPAYTLAWLAGCALVTVLGFLAIRFTAGAGPAVDAPRPVGVAAGTTSGLVGADGQDENEDGIDAAAPAEAPQTTASMRAMLLPLVLSACVTLCVSPIAWSHHWVWASPALITALALAWKARDRRRLWLAAAAAALFVGFPASWFPRSNNIEMHWAWWQQIIGSAYVYVAIGVLGYFAATGLIRRRREAVGTTAEAAAETAAGEDDDATRPASSSSAQQPFPTSGTRDRVRTGSSRAST
ncbi:MAG TPA: glycosyltransferase 87 family protein [Actinocrinis sp.]|nr:glycosyltransferase 87 family protein [Actinocrinis sp.]